MTNGIRLFFRYSPLCICALLVAQFSAAESLPIIRISVEEPIADSPSPDPGGGHRWTECSFEVLKPHADGLEKQTAAIRVRGQSSRRWPQKSYSVEIRDRDGEELNVPVLGMPAAADWILYAAYGDPSLVRNVFTYDLARELHGGFGGVRTRYVELELVTSGSSKAQGLYVLMEKIERGENRVAIEKLRKKDAQEPEITGGYLFKRDAGPTGVQFHTRSGIQLEVLDPGKPTALQVDWLRAWINEMECALPVSDQDNGKLKWREYIDAATFVDHVVFVEALKNAEGVGRSAYFHKDRGGKLKALPVWDYDLAMGNTIGEFRTPEEWVGTNMSPVSLGWYGWLMMDAGFAEAASKRYRELRRGPLSDEAISFRIRRLLKPVIASEANLRHYELWKIPGVAEGGRHATLPPASQRHAEAVAKLEQFLFNRMKWLDNQPYWWGKAPRAKIKSQPVNP